MKNFRWILRLIGLLLFIVILRKIDLIKIFMIFSKSNMPMIFFCIIINIIIIYLIRAYKWKILLASQKIKISFKEAIIIFFASLFIGSVTPGRIGELIRIYYIKRKGFSLGKSSVSIFIDRIQDIIFLVIMGILGLAIFLSIFKKQVMIISGTLIIVIVLSIVFILNKKIRLFLYNFFINFLLPNQFRKSFKKNINDFVFDLSRIKYLILIKTFLLTLLAWFTYYFILFSIAKVMNINMPFIYFVACLSISSLVTILPISFSGIGTRDIIFILIFSKFGLSSESAVAFSAVILFTYVLTTFFGLISWLYNPIKMRSKNN